MGLGVFFLLQKVSENVHKAQSVADLDNQIWGNIELDLFRLHFIFLVTLISYFSSNTEYHQIWGNVVFFLPIVYGTKM